jgi:hypothetical protein
VVHDPQCEGSVLVSTHADPHNVVPPAQLSAHAPPLQTSPDAHGVPHPPQFAGSVVVSTHFVPHFVVPPAQLSAHLPALHT